ncbi:hypothetical protein [Accumulibacter sp.]|uniref:hypothetical protein n=1 Tax=Accumulibacter sp. TaxID=2053492 RepID=UPI0028C4C021|nr:hypothetical protein [Accumulibacter sp.]
MKALIVAGALSLAAAGVSGEAAAACALPSVRVNTISGPGSLNELLSGKTVCVPAVTTDPMTWQEEHRAGGELWDYKRGTNPMDPSEKVGTWAVTGANNRAVFVTHTYLGGGGTYSYSVWANTDGTHSFCGTGPEIVAKIKPSIGSGC